MGGFEGATNDGDGGFYNSYHCTRRGPISYQNVGCGWWRDRDGGHFSGLWSIY